MQLVKDKTKTEQTRNTNWDLLLWLLLKTRNGRQETHNIQWNSMTFILKRDKKKTDKRMKTRLRNDKIVQKAWKYFLQSTLLTCNHSLVECIKFLEFEVFMLSIICKTHYVFQCMNYVQLICFIMLQIYLFIRTMFFYIWSQKIK